jgi:hypothetical protein
MAQLCKDNKDAAFYSGKIYSARFFAKNVLPEVDATAVSIQDRRHVHPRDRRRELRFIEKCSGQ